MADRTPGRPAWPRQPGTTTNGSQLERLGLLRAAGVRRLNISLDSLRADRFVLSPASATSTRCCGGIAPPAPEVQPHQAQHGDDAAASTTMNSSISSGSP